MPDALSVKAGPKAFSIIKERGLQPDDVAVMAGAAGGPKWLVLGSLDRVIFSSFFKNRQAPLFLVGSSIGAMRFATVSQNNVMDAIDRFEEAYVNQSYINSVTPADVTEENIKLIKTMLGETGVEEILNHPYLRTNIMSVFCRHLVSNDKKPLLLMGLAGSAILNIINRNLLKFFFARELFYHPLGTPPFSNMNGFPIHKTLLSKDNIADALLASSSIPLIMSGVKNIPGARPGVYRDGGLIDYHLDIPFIKEKDALVLYPHYTDRIIPGWMDKKLPWRKPTPSNIDNVVLISPSKEFIKNLPMQKVPDRNDLITFRNNEKERIACWQQAIEKCRQLGDEFMNAVDSNKIRKMVEPL